jgi:3-phosphoshikimate 1-carboxyvinyltransferase
MGAQLRWQQGSLSVEEGRRQALTINAAPIPDLIPALAAVAAVSDGVTVIEQAGRLRLKESDRLAAIAQTLNALGAKVTEEDEGLRIEGVTRLTGGSVDAWGDHRIAMMAAIASAACENPVTIRGAEAVNKSYPSFWRVLASLGKTVREEGEA